MKKYISELRVSNYVKNLIIALPLICGNSMFDIDILMPTIIGFITFCLLSSSTYVLNDIFDKERDKYSPEKSRRPVSSGQISIVKAVGLSACLLIISMILQVMFFGLGTSLLVSVMYYALCILYCLFIKKVPYLEIICVASFYIFRLYYGSVISNIPVSLLLLITVIFVSLYFCMGKRYAELGKDNSEKIRNVLISYSKDTLMKLMYVSAAASMVCYVIWSHCSKAPNGVLMPFTSIIVFFLFMRYTGRIKKTEYGDPVYMLFNDYVIMILSIVLALVIIFILYYPNAILAF